VVRYAEAIEPIASSGGFQLVHAHDWMTFPAALHVKEMTGVPAILHVHSLELDRCPDGTDDRIFKIEKTSFKAADHIIAVSFYTKNRLVQRYDVPEWKISVIHNAVSRQDSGWSREVKRPYGKKIVLFLGRITSQKGPEYFIDAAAQVIEQDDSVWFVMAGSGDMLPKMIERTAQLKIGRNFHFTGFLHGSDVEKMYSMSDVYVMPSISEPFGITGLEAILYDVPVILTKQAGVSEVLHHALTVDYWNVDELATAILSVLKHPAMRDSMVRMCKDEIEGVCWERAAEKIDDVYRNVLAGVGGT
jgi:glycogen(starch) synthase